VTEARLPALSLNEWAVLALLAEQPSHGFALAKELDVDGDLGQIWTVRRPFVYRALAHLEQLSLVAQEGVEPGRAGPRRTVFGPTPAGRAAVDRWLATPTAHVRDLRTRLLLQLRVLDRRGRDLAPLAAAQLRQLAPLVRGLADQVGERSDFGRLLAQWRLEQANAAVRFLERVEGEQPSGPGADGSRRASGQPARGRGAPGVVG